MSRSPAQPTDRPHPAGRPPVLVGARVPLVVSAVLAFLAVLAAAPSLFFPDLLGGTAVLDGNVRGTSLVVLLVGVPLLLLGMSFAARGSARGLVAWLGAAAYLTYQGVLFCFSTPLNSLFLVYVACLGAGIWALITLWHAARPVAFAGRVGEHVPVRLVGGVLAAFALLNAVGWVAQVVPTIGDARPADVLVGSGLITNAVWVQDLAFWIPLAVLAGGWCWRRVPAGLLLAGAMLTFYVVEALSVASDQWWGVRADDAWPRWASMAAVPMFLVVALVTALPLIGYYRNLDAGA